MRDRSVMAWAVLSYSLLLGMAVILGGYAIAIVNTNIVSQEESKQGQRIGEQPSAQEPRRVGPDPAFVNTPTPLVNWAPYETIEEVDKYIRARYVFERDERATLIKTLADLNRQIGELRLRIEKLEEK